MHRGQAEVVAALLSTLVLVAAFAILWISLYPQYLGLEQSVQRNILYARLAAREQLVLERARLQDGKLNLTIANTGDFETTLIAVYLNETLAWNGALQIPPGASKSLEAPAGSAASYVIKLCTLRGNCWAFQETATTTTTPPPPPAPQQPLFSLVSWNQTISGPPSGKARLVFTLANNGAVPGAARVEVYNHSGGLVNQTLLAVPGGSQATGELTVTLPPTPGTYTWTIKVYNNATGVYDDSKTFIVAVQTPVFRITSYNTSISGLPGSTAKLVVTVSNDGSVPGTARVEVYDNTGALKASQTLTINAGSTSTASLALTLPSNTGTYTWTLKVLNVQTGVYDDSKTFTVRVADLVLLSRTAFLYESFETMPANWASIGGSWSNVSGGWSGNALQGTDDNKGPGRESVYYYSGNIPQSFQAIVKIGGVSRNDGIYRGFALLEKLDASSRLYEISAMPSGNFIYLYIWRYSGGWSRLASSAASYVSTWYTVYLSYTLSGNQNTLAATLYDSSGNPLTTVSATDSTFTPAYLGLAVDGGSSLFDEVVAATGDPRYVRVTGLQPGWTVELWNGSKLVASAVADAGGAASLNVLQLPIIRGAT
ncbi:MAG: hypothetical protein ABWK01_07490, partial [Infirmifilum sp.]